MEVTTRTIIGCGLLVLALLFILHMAGMIEGFDAAYDAALAAKLKETGTTLMNQADVCMAKTSCSTCLETASCGWCPTAAKCVPKVNTYPIIPEDSPFSCPPSEFISEKGRCSDIACSSFKTCRDCADSVKCGWCGDSNVCLPKDANNALIVPVGTICEAGAAVKNSGECPSAVCNTITDCVECAGTPGCSFCETAKKCVRFEDKKDAEGKVVEPRDAAIEGCNEETTITSPSQCPSARALQGSSSLQKGPTASDIASAQDNSVRLAEQAVASTEGPVSPATAYTVVSAPGVLRPLGSTSVRPSFPAAAGLDDLKGGPFEKYVQMLVKSELVAQGKTPSVAAEPFVANEEGAIANATGYVKGAWQGIFGRPADVRI